MYFYTQDGIAGLRYNATRYYFIKNLQGDVTHIIDATGTNGDGGVCCSMIWRLPLQKRMAIHTTSTKKME
jgi:hypothetical protein